MEVLGNYSNQHTSNSGRGSTSNNSRNHHRPSSLQLMGVAAKHKVLQMNQPGKKGLNQFVKVFLLAAKEKNFLVVKLSSHLINSVN